MELLRRQGLQLQHFLSKACFVPVDGASAVTGVASRHLDSWLMPAEVCRELFVHGTRSADLALVEGRFEQSRGVDIDSPAFEPLCDWLGLPRVAVLDVSQWDRSHVPSRPPGIDGVLFDRICGDADFCRLQTLFESLWGVPVLGALEELPGARAELSRLGGGRSPAPELCRELGDNFAQYARLKEVLALAARRRNFEVAGQLFRTGLPLGETRVAIAYDAAFHCYFPDTLELLEHRGATLVDFSPLKDESLPPGTEIVYFGCGHPERFARQLAANHCMMLALRSHVCQGRRIYAEGGGLAYLCRQIEMPDGSRFPMAGILPAVARKIASPGPAQPVEVTLAAGNWLGGPGTRLRGYLNSAWQVEPADELACYVTERGHGHDLVGRHHALASRIHLNFAAQPNLLRGFLQPHAPSLQCAQGRATAR